MTRIAPAISSADFAEAARLFALMADWDVAMSAKLGFTEVEIRTTFYADSAEDLARIWQTDNAQMLLAWDAEAAVGCVAFECAGLEGKITRFFVDPAARRRGHGSSLFAAALAALNGRGVVIVRLMTASFMHAAHALYRAHGFVDCEPFEEVGERFTSSTLFMECCLAPTSEGDRRERTSGKEAPRANAR